MTSSIYRARAVQGDDDNRLDADALRIMAASRVIDLRDGAGDIVELLADPKGLPAVGTASPFRLHRLLAEEREANRRLRCRLRAALLVGPDG